MHIHVRVVAKHGFQRSFCFATFSISATFNPKHEISILNSLSQIQITIVAFAAEIGYVSIFSEK
jgi:hypothetical protein